MSKIIQEMRDNQLSQTALNFANTSKISGLEPTILYSLHNFVKKFYLFATKNNTDKSLHSDYHKVHSKMLLYAAVQFSPCPIVQSLTV